MALLVQSINHGDMNKTYSKTIGYYVIKFVSEAYTLKEYKKYDGNIST